MQSHDRSTMRVVHLLAFFVGVIVSNLAFCADFNERGVALNLPAGFKAVKPLPDLDNLLVRTFRWQSVSISPIAMQVQIRWLIDEDERLGRTLTTRSGFDAAGLCLAVDMEQLRFLVKNIAITNSQEIRLSEKIGAVLTFSGIAQATSDRKAGFDSVRAMIYCVSEPKREIIFRLFGPADQANDIFNDVARSIENVAISK